MLILFYNLFIMKAIKLVFILFILVWLLFPSYSKADDSNSYISNMFLSWWVSTQGFWKEFHDLLKERNDTIMENRQEIKDSILSYREEYKNDLYTLRAWMTKSEIDNLKADILSSKMDYVLELQNLKEYYKWTLWEDWKLEDFFEDLSVIRENYYTKVEDLFFPFLERELWEDKANQIKNDRRVIFEANEALRSENVKTRIEFRSLLGWLVDKYRAIFNEKLKQILPSLSDDKLEEIYWKIVQMYENIVEDQDMAQWRKERILAQLLAIQEIIEDELESRIDY